MSLNCFGGHSRRRKRRKRSSSLDLLCGRLERARLDPDQGRAIFYTELIGFPDELSGSRGTKLRLETNNCRCERMEESLMNIRPRRSSAKAQQDQRNKTLQNDYGGNSPQNSPEVNNPDPYDSDSSLFFSKDLRMGVALCDNNPSPYDREGLPFRVGDRIQILAMNPNGMWRGRVHDREGTFKFIHVKLLHNNQHRRRHSAGTGLLDTNPANMKAVLSAAHLDCLTPLLILNGYDSVEDIIALTEEDLEYLGMTRDEQLRILEAAASVLHPESSNHNLPDLIQPLQSRAGARGEKTSSRPSVLYSRLSWHPSYLRLLDGGERPPQRRRPFSAEVGSQLFKKQQWLQAGKRRTQQL
jgi:hypothetical protein